MLFAAAALDLRQHLVDDGIFRKGLAKGRIEALQQVCHRFIVTTHEGDASFFALSSQRCATDRRDLTDRYLTA